MFNILVALWAEKLKVKAEEKGRAKDMKWGKKEQNLDGQTDRQTAE